MVTIVNNTVLFNWHLLRDWRELQCFHQKKKKKRREIRMWGSGCDGCVNYHKGANPFPMDACRTS